MSARGAKHLASERYKMAFSYDIEIKDKSLRAMLEKKLDRLDDLTGFYADVSEHLYNTTIDRFETETAPDGSNWPDLSPVTIAAREKAGTGTTKLRASGHLVGSINYRASSEDARIGSPVVYAAIQNFSGKAGRGQSVFIPQRQFIGLSPEDELAIVEIADEYLSE